MLKTMMTMLIMIWASEVYSQQTLGGFGAGGMNGGGFGDPVANDYAGIDRRINFQTGLLMGYNAEQSMKYAAKMGRIRAIQNRKYAQKSSDTRYRPKHDPFLKEAEKRVESTWPMVIVPWHTTK